MKLTAEQYVTLSYTLRKDNASDLIYHEEETIKQHVEAIQKQVADRMKFHIPFSIINTYNVNSCIIPLDSSTDYHHFIDIALFGYFKEFLSAMELDLPNLSVFYYRNLRHDICLSKKDEVRALLYKPQSIYANQHDADYGLGRRTTELEQTKYQIMLEFYFLHEYMHYLVANPIRDAVNDLTDNVAETLLKHLNKMNNPNFAEADRPFQRAMYNRYCNEWNNNSCFREEIYCDFQAVLCLLELPGAYRRDGCKIDVETIFDSVVSFLYIHHIIFLAKNNDNPITIGDDFAFRINCICMLAWLMEDKEYADMLCELMQRGNRYFIPVDLQLRRLCWKQQKDFYSQLTQVIIADKNQVIKDGSYVFPIFEQPKYLYTPEYMEKNNIPPWFAIPSNYV